MPGMSKKQQGGQRLECGGRKGRAMDEGGQKGKQMWPIRRDLLLLLML